MGTDTFSGVYDFGAAGTFDYVINLAPGTADIVSEVVTPAKDTSHNYTGARDSLDKAAIPNGSFYMTLAPCHGVARCGEQTHSYA